MGQNHLDTIAITIVLEPAAAPQRGFGTTLLVVDKATNTLNGARAVRYASLTDAVADEAAGYISAATLAAVTVAFSQQPRPTDILVGNIDTVGAETYAAALAAIEVADPDFYGVCIYDRGNTAILAAAAYIEAATPGRLLFVQSDDADWITTGTPAALAALDGNERTIVIYHDDDTAWNDVAWACSRLSFDPDVTSAPWPAEVKQVAALDALTAGEKAFARANNANIGLPFGGIVMWMDPGTNMNGRPIYEILTADWFQDRLQAKTADLLASKSASGEKLTVDDQGQVQLLSLVLAQFAEGESARHFKRGQYTATGTTITSADLTAGKLRITGAAQLAVAARLVDYDLNFGTAAVV